jgi:hypothetical protein
VDTLSPVSSLELFGADTADMAMPAAPIVKRIDVVGHIGQSEDHALSQSPVGPLTRSH